MILRDSLYSPKSSGTQYLIIENDVARPSISLVRSILADTLSKPRHRVVLSTFMHPPSTYVDKKGALHDGKAKDIVIMDYSDCSWETPVGPRLSTQILRKEWTEAIEAGVLVTISQLTPTN
jgi:hypothetical protein